MAELDAPPRSTRRLLLCTAVLWLAFALLALATRAGWTLVPDEFALHAARALRAAHPSLTGSLRDLSGFGSTLVLFLLSIATAGWLAWIGEARAALVVLAAAVLGFIVDNVAKDIVARARPAVADAAFAVSTYSYPSGHAAFSALVFGVLATALCVRRPLRERRYAIGVALVFAALVGASRVLLGVHWASDVLGGWMLGAGGALVATAVLRARR